MLRVKSCAVSCLPVHSDDGLRQFLGLDVSHVAFNPSLWRSQIPSFHVFCLWGIAPLRRDGCGDWQFWLPWLRNTCTYSDPSQGRPAGWEAQRLASSGSRATQWGIEGCRAEPRREAITRPGLQWTHEALAICGHTLTGTPYTQDLSATNYEYDFDPCRGHHLQGIKPTVNKQRQSISSARFIVRKPIPVLHACLLHEGSVFIWKISLLVKSYFDLLTYRSSNLASNLGLVCLLREFYETHQVHCLVIML